jgi:hypothetical protein
MEHTVKADAGIRHDPEFPRLYKRDYPRPIDEVIHFFGERRLTDRRPGAGAR